MSVDRYDPFGMKSKEDFTETVKILLNYGADVNTQNARGETPMHLAARNEFQKVIEVLVLAGCDPVLEDNDGNRAADLTSDGDTVSLQILRHAAAERDRYLCESMEIRARGFTTLTQSQAALPLCVRSPSLMSVPLLMGAANSAQNLTRVASTPGIFASPPQTAMYPGQLSPGYPGVVMPQNGFQQSQGSPGLIAVEPTEPDLYSNISRTQYSANGADASTCRDSFASNITAPTDNAYRLSVNSAATPSVPVYSSVGPSEKSSVWNVTPPPSVTNQTVGQPGVSDKKDPAGNHKGKILKNKSKSSNPPPVARKPMVANQPVLVQRAPDVQVSLEPLAEDADSYFDDESFDTFVESSFTEEEMVVPPPPPLPPRSRTSQSSVGAESSLQRWLDEQNGLMRSDVSVTSFNSTTTVSGSTAPPARPPRLSRPSSVTSTDTVKRRPPPPIPAAKVQKEKPKSHKKRSKDRSTPVEKVEVDSEDWITRQALKNHHWEDDDMDQRNNNVRKTSKRKVKKKKTDTGIGKNNDLYDNVDDSLVKQPQQQQPVKTNSNSSFVTEGGDTNVSEQKSSQSVQETPVARPAQPLVFEKVSLQDNQITSDYLFHKAIAELTTASAENIVECVGRKMSSESSPPPASHNLPVANAVLKPTSGPPLGHSPQPVFQYPAAMSSSFSRQTPLPDFVQQAPFLLGNRLQTVYSNPLVSVRPVLHDEDALPHRQQQQQQNRPVAYSVPLQQSSDPDSFHSHVSPDEQSLYDTLDDDKLNMRDSGGGFADDQMPPYGLNRRTVSLKSDAGKPLGFTVCGGNVSGTFVRSVTAKSAAAAAGLTCGDWIVAINGKVVKSLSKQDVLLRIEKLAPDLVRLVVDRDDDRYNLAAAKNAVGDSFYVRAHFCYTPAARDRELPVKEADVFQVSDSLPYDAVGYWVAKKVSGPVGDPEGLIPNSRRAEQMLTKQRLQASPTLNRPRGGIFMRSFRRSKYSDRSSDADQDSLDSRQSSECGEIVPYVRVVEQSSSVRRPVVVMGLFCDAVCTLLCDDAPGIFEAPKNAVEQRRASGEEFTPSMLDLATIRGIVNSGRHCVMVVSPRAVQFLREKTELQPIVVYMSPSSKNVLKSMIVQLALGCDKKPSFMLDEAAKFERFHSALFDAVIPYKADGSWLDTLKDTVGGLQRHRRWIPFEPEDSYITSGSSSPPNLVRTTRSSRNDEHAPSRGSKTTDDIPDQIQDLLARHINVVSPMISEQPTNVNDVRSRSFDFGGDRKPVLVKPPKAVSPGPQHGDVVLRKPRTRGRPIVGSMVRFYIIHTVSVKSLPCLMHNFVTILCLFS